MVEINQHMHGMLVVTSFPVSDSWKLPVPFSSVDPLGLDLFSIIVNSTESLSENNQAELGDSPSMTFTTQSELLSTW